MSVIPPCTKVAQLGTRVACFVDTAICGNDHDMGKDHPRFILRWGQFHSVVDNPYHEGFKAISLHLAGREERHVDSYVLADILWELSQGWVQAVEK